MIDRRPFLSGRAVKLSSALCVATMIFAGATRAAPPPTGNWQMIFNDEFNGASLDLQKWDTISVCCGHQQFNAYNLGRNCIVANGYLREVLKKESWQGQPYTAAAITSRTFRGKQGMYFEIRCKFSKGNGLWPAFWMDGIDNPVHYEVDFLEQRGHQITVIDGPSLHKWTGGHIGTGSSYDAGVDLSQDFHVYGMEFKAQNTAVCYFDDRQKSQVSGFLPNDDFGSARICANFQSNTINWGPPIDNTTVLPAYYDIDYIRVYQKSATPVAERDAGRLRSIKTVTATGPVVYYNLNGERVNSACGAELARWGRPLNAGITVAVPADSREPGATARLIVR